MLSFLDASTCRRQISQILQRGCAVRAAVAYWGDGAIDELGIKAGADLTVICDVRGGGSNPVVVSELIRLLGEQRVLTHDRLHAKVWVAEDRAIVGSSNASSNGLGKEGLETTSLLEANLLIDDRTAIAELNDWLDNVVLPGARTVTDDDLKVGAKRHGRPRDGRPAPEAGDLLSLLRTEPERFVNRNFFVWVWDPEKTGKWTEAEIQKVRATRPEKNILFYQDCKAPPGAYILDFGATAGNGNLVGLYQVLKDQPIHKAKSGTLLLCRKTDTFDGLRLGNHATWCAAARRAAQSGGEEWQIADFARKFLI